jgi:hypothetical protein
MIDFVKKYWYLFAALVVYLVYEYFPSSSTPQTTSTPSSGSTSDYSNSIAALVANYFNQYLDRDPTTDEINTWLSKVNTMSLSLDSAKSYLDTGISALVPKTTSSNPTNYSVSVADAVSAAQDNPITSPTVKPIQDDPYSDIVVNAVVAAATQMIANNNQLFLTQDRAAWSTTALYQAAVMESNGYGAADITNALISDQNSV